MVTVHRSSEFDAWLSGLRDAAGRYKVLARIVRLEAGNPGDVKPVGQGVSELRIAFGPGYRVYFMARGVEVAILLAGATSPPRRRTSRGPRPSRTGGSEGPWMT